MLPLLLAVVASMALAAPRAAAQYTPVAFSAPVKLTQFADCGGYEPTVIVDKYQNVVVTAHKQNQCDGVAFDPQQTPPARAQSWAWGSSDGVNFTDMPGIAAGSVDTNAQSLDVGDEGDLARDDAGHLYLVDTKVADNSFTSWTATGNGQVTETFHTPAMGTAQPVDDRPWITAHGNGVVMYAGNTGNSSVYSSPNGNGSGRFTVYMSYDGGNTFDHVGVTVPNSGWCRPAADHRAGSQLLYLVCTNDAGGLFAYVSTDDGKTATGWASHPIDTYNASSAGWGSSGSWPVAAVGPDGAVYTLYTDQDSAGAFHVNLYRSLDSGTTWTKWADATQQQGKIATNAGPSWLDVAPDGSLGVDYFLNPPGDANWHIEAGTAPGWKQPFTMVDAAPNLPPATAAFGAPWGDFLTCAFGPDSRLHVAWTDAAQGTTLGQQGLNSDIYYAEETPPPAVNTPEAPSAVLLLLVGGAGLTVVLARRRSAGRRGEGSVAV